MDKVRLLISRMSTRIQPHLNQVPVLLRLKEAVKRLYFLRWRGKHTEIYIVSYPKSGRTWLRLLLGKVVCDIFGVSDKEALDTYNLTKELAVPCVQFTHDGTDNEYARAFSDLRISRSVFKDNKVVLLTRDPRDLLVSNYYQSTKRENVFDEDLSSFVRSDKHGIRKIQRFYSIWHEEAQDRENFLHLRYEELHRNPQKVLKELLHFIGLEQVKEDFVQSAVSFASFGNMKNMEREHYFNKVSMRPADVEDENSYKVRKGEIGGYDEELSEDDLVCIERVLKEYGSPFYPDLIT